MSGGTSRGWTEELGTQGRWLLGNSNENGKEHKNILQKRMSEET